MEQFGTIWNNLEQFTNLKKLNALLLMMFVTFYSVTNAQNSCQQWFSAYRVDVTSKFSGQTPTYPNCGALDCNEMLYEFRLVKVGGSVTNTFDYTGFQVSGKVSVNGLSSYIDKKRSQLFCTPPWTAAQFAIEPDGRFTLNLGDVLSSEPTASQSLPMDANGTFLLFSIVVHAPPGGIISISDDTPGNQSPYLFVYGRNNTFGTCKGYFPVTYGGASSPAVTMPSIATCTGTGYYSIDVPVQYNFLAPGGNIPIKLLGLPTGTVIEQLEAVVEVRTNNDMQYGNVGTQIFDCPFFLDNTCRIKSVPSESNGVKIQTIYASGENIQYDAANSMLLNIFFLGPVNQSLQDQATITVKFVRVKINGVCCLLRPGPNMWSEVYASFPGFSTCPDFQVSLTELPVTPTNCRVSYRANLGWSTSATSYNFEAVRFKIKFHSKIPFSVFENNTICSGNSCTTATEVSPNFWEISCNLTNVNLPKNVGFDIVFDGQNGCVDKYNFTQSEIKLLSSSNACAPNLPNPKSPNNYQKCAAKLAGNVTYKYTSECDNYFIKATSTGNACDFNTTLSNNATAFSYCACKEGFPFKVDFSKADNGNYTKGLSTYDCVIISKHVLGVAPLDDDFKYVAADVDGSQSITTNDISRIRQLILGVKNDLGYLDVPLNAILAPSYKLFNFVPTSQNFLVTSSTASNFVQLVNTATNFYVVKNGDVTWDPASSPLACLTGNDLDNRSNYSVEIQLPYKPITAGHLLKIPVIVNENTSAAAIQLELGFNPSKFRYTGFQSGDILNVSSDCIGEANVLDGKWRLAWFDPKGAPVQLKVGAILGYLSFETLDEIGENEIHLNRDDNSLPALVFNENGIASDLYQIAKKTVVGDFEIALNPNPFHDDAQLIVNIATDASCQMTILDETARVISNRRIQMSAGKNEITLNEDDFTQLKGVFSVQVQTDNAVKTLKVIRH